MIYSLVLLLIPAAIQAAAPAKNPADMNNHEVVQAAIENRKALEAAENEIYDKAYKAVLVPEQNQKVQDAIPCMPKVLCALIAEYWRPVLNPLPLLQQVFEQAVPETTKRIIEKLVFDSRLIVYQIQHRFPDFREKTNKARWVRNRDYKFSQYGFLEKGDDESSVGRYCAFCYHSIDTYAEPAFINPAVWHGADCRKKKKLVYEQVPDDPSQLRDHVISCLYFFHLKDSIFMIRTSTSGNEMPLLEELEQLEKQCVTNS